MIDDGDLGSSLVVVPVDAAVIAIAVLAMVAPGVWCQQMSGGHANHGSRGSSGDGGVDSVILITVVAAMIDVVVSQSVMVAMTMVAWTY